MDAKLDAVVYIFHPIIDTILFFNEMESILVFKIIKGFFLPCGRKRVGSLGASEADGQLGQT